MSINESFIRQSHWKFFLQWLKSPLDTAAITPSGSHLVAAMLKPLPPKTQRVIELGAGTGPLTNALLKKGITAENLLALELNLDLCQLLKRRFPKLQLLQGNACELYKLASDCGYLNAGPADAILSSLGLLAMDQPTQVLILFNAFACLKPTGVFIQFTYGPRPPLPSSVVSQLDLQVRRGAFVLRNLPPATVYIYSRRTEYRVETTNRKLGVLCQ